MNTLQLQELTEDQLQSLSMMLRIYSTEDCKLEVDFFVPESATNMYILYISFNGHKIGFGSFGDIVTYLAGYAMGKGL